MFEKINALSKEKIKALADKKKEKGIDSEKEYIKMVLASVDTPTVETE